MIVVYFYNFFPLINKANTRKIAIQKNYEPVIGKSHEKFPGNLL